MSDERTMITRNQSHADWSSLLSMLMIITGSWALGFILHCFIALGLNSFSTFMNYIFALYEGAIFFIFLSSKTALHIK